MLIRNDESYKTFLRRFGEYIGKVSPQSTDNPLTNKTVSIRAYFIQIFGILRIGWILTRPAFAALLSLWGVRTIHRILFQKASKSISTLRLLFLAACGKLLWEISHDGVLFPSFARGKKTLKPGLFLHGERSKKIAAEASLEKQLLTYRPPLLLWNGDLATVIPTVRNDLFGKPWISSRYHRVHSVCSREGEKVALDWIFPRDANTSSPTRIALLLPGIGGCSTAGYVMEVADEFTKEGWSVCVLNPRGLNDAPPCKDVRYLCSIDEMMADIHAVVLHINNTMYSSTPEDNMKKPPDMCLVGFSLGGILLARYLVGFGSTIPSNVFAAVSFSAAFAMGFTKWKRYRDTYQRVLVPLMMSNIRGKYDPSLLVEHKISITDMDESVTFRDLIENLCIPIIKSTPEQLANAKDWRVRATQATSFKDYLERVVITPTERERIDRPFLFVTACDDPFHHPDETGVEMEHTNPNVLYGVTSMGGHVSWPSGAPMKFHFMRRVATSFVNAAARVIMMDDEERKARKERSEPVIDLESSNSHL